MRDREDDLSCVLIVYRSTCLCSQLCPVTRLGLVSDLAAKLRFSNLIMI